MLRNILNIFVRAPNFYVVWFYKCKSFLYLYINKDYLLNRNLKLPNDSNTLYV
jgi:hypothetical protein